MKKIVVFILFVLGVLFPIFYGVKVSASCIVSDSYKENYYLDKKLYYHDGVEFNYLCQRSQEEYYQWL